MGRRWGEEKFCLFFLLSFIEIFLPPSFPSFPFSLPSCNGWERTHPKRNSSMWHLSHALPVLSTEEREREVGERETVQ